MESIQSADQLQQCILAATDPTSAAKNAASSMLNHMCNMFPDAGSALCVQLMKQVYEQSEDKTFNVQEQHQIDNVIFYTFTTLQRALSKRCQNSECIVPLQCRAELRRNIYHYILRFNDGTQKVLKSERVIPKYLRTKIGVVMSLLIQVDFPDRWQSAFQELMQVADSGARSSLIEIIRKDIFLRTLDGFCDEVVEQTSIERNTMIKDYIRGLNSPFAPAIPVENSISTSIIRSIMVIFQSSIGSVYEPKSDQLGKLEMQRLPMKALYVLKRIIPWVDMSLFLNDAIIGSLLACLMHAGPGDIDDDNGEGSLASQCATEAVDCFKEIVSKGMEDQKKIEMITDLNLLQRIIESGVNLDTVDGTHINIVIRIAELVTMIGIEITNFWESATMNNMPSDQIIELMSSQLNLLLALFFKCFAYDDIDVSGAVIPLASRFVSTLEKEMNAFSRKKEFSISAHMPQMLSVMYEQMKYPSDFGFDYEDEDDAEEEMYRAELRKLNQTVIRICPEMAMQFLCNALSQIQAPLASAETNQLEAALRLIYHYSEGVRPIPGVKVVLKNQMFRDVLIALHSSDVVAHPHREVIILYYDIVVRYAGILQDKPELLPNILTSISGSRGLQHDHPRVRSRSCYLLLKLVKSLGSTLRPFVETAIGGIQGLLSNQTLSLHPDDTLYLFETIGLLLGRTELSDDEQQRYLLAVITPHMHRMEYLLKSPDMQSDPDNIGNNIAYSLASLAFLTKGLSRNNSPGVQSILAETTQTSIHILRALPNNNVLRNKTMIYLQRMIICLGEKVLMIMPQYLQVLITHCTQEDLLDVSQLLHQLCCKFKARMIPIVDESLLPFLKKCHELIPDTNEKEGADLPPHLVTEQLHTKKIMFAFLYQVVTKNCTPALLSPTNVGSLEGILKMVGDGAINVPDPNMKKACVQFFKELSNQWLVNGVDGSNTNIVRGFQTYLEQTFIPGVFGIFLQDSYNVKDALQYRVVREMVGILSLLKLKRGMKVETMIAAAVTSKGYPVSVLASVSAAKTKDEMEAAIKTLLQTVKQK